MLKKYFIKCLYLFLVVLILTTNICNATEVPITDENLEEALLEYISLVSSKEDYEKYDDVKVSNNVITLTKDNESYDINYDLTDKPTFTYEVTIEEGMSYEEYNEKTDRLNLPSIGYVAIANIQGTEMEDAMTYFILTYIDGALKGISSTENSYMIVDDLNLSEGITLEKTDDPKVIYTSEFGDRVMEYVDGVYKDKTEISDSEDINSYELIIEKTDVTDTSCKLVSKLTVNPEADFSKIKGYVEQVEDAFINKDITNITKENADYVVTLKVGQKCKIESTEKITQIVSSGNDCIEFNDDMTEITAKSAGITKGYFYIGEEKKSIYITVEENPENATLETITLKLDSELEVETPNSSSEVEKEEVKEEIKENNETVKDNTISSSSYPKTGIGSYLVLIILICSIIMIIIKTKLTKYRDIK